MVRHDRVATFCEETNVYADITCGNISDWNLTSCLKSYDGQFNTIYKMISNKMVENSSILPLEIHVYNWLKSRGQFSCIPRAKSTWTGVSLRHNYTREFPEFIHGDSMSYQPVLPAGKSYILGLLMFDHWPSSSRSYSAVSFRFEQDILIVGPRGIKSGTDAPVGGWY